MACSNPIAINNGTVGNFGFSTTFNPYAKTVTFDLTTLSSFISINGVIVSFRITDPNGQIIGDLDYATGSNSIDVDGGDLIGIVPLVTGGALFFGKYTIEARIWTDLSTHNDMSFDVTVCHDSRLENNNSIKGCITVDSNCSTAKMIIKEQTNFKYNGLSPVSKNYLGTLTYPDNYIAQTSFSYVPFSISLEGSITGLYQVKVTTNAVYELDGCHSYLEVPYISQWIDDVSCSGALSTILCCWAQSYEIAQKGGTIGAQMHDKMIEAGPVFSLALLLEHKGKNSEWAVSELQKMLGCDCKCQKGLTIQANPIMLGDKNIVGLCGTTAAANDDGDIEISSYIIELGVCEDTSGFSFNKTVDSCTKTWCLTVDFAVVQQQVLNAIAGDSDAILNWQEVLGINSCPCKANVLWLSQNGLPPATDNPLLFSQVSVCGGNVISFTPQTATSIQSIVDYLNANTSVNDYGVFSLSGDGTGIVTSFVPTDGACTIMVYLYQSCSTTVIVNDAPLIMDVERLSDYYRVLQDTYFVKSDTVVSIDLKDQTSITNGVLGTITISESTTGSVASITVLDDTYTLDANQCGSDLIEKTGVITQQTITSMGCQDTKTCPTSYSRVAYSERWTAPYRSNPQINDLPYYADYIYLNNSSSGLREDSGSVIRYFDTETKEVRQIAGNEGLLKTPQTANDVWGDVVEYYYASSVYVDKSDIHNGHPTLYFCTFGGNVCKLVRERSTECDERANWKNYIIAGLSWGSVPAPETGSDIKFLTPYGIKRFGTINGQPSFIIFNYGTHNLEFIYYKIVSGVNDSDNWFVSAYPIGAPIDIGNINVDRGNRTVGESTYTDIPVLYVFGSGKIDKYFYIGSETSSTDILNVSNYVAVSVIDKVMGTVDGLGSTVARVYNPDTLSKITYNSLPTYVFSQEYAGGYPAGSQVLRGFYQESVDIDLFNFVTIVPDNNKAFSTFGKALIAPTANGMTMGMFWHPVKNKYYEFPVVGGIRSFCPNQDVTQSTIIYANESGAESAIATQQDYTTGIVDTNYELIIDCNRE